MYNVFINEEPHHVSFQSSDFESDQSNIVDADE